ncbi:MAG: cytochrome d ubiquinol oxidase subunit 2 [Chlamydiia bacterium]|nr:cytochrome d ubiquinol oxidase subunit 2 [Chlamydiia bacterium]
MDLSLETLQLVWYTVVILSMFAYAALDGFDIGVGCLHLFARTDLERRIFLNAIGPIWDSNSLWVVITSGAMLAGFPIAFATLFSALYLPMLLLVFGYVLRAVAIEFRSKMESTTWRSTWDSIFALASYSLAFGFGLTLANLIKGLPINDEGVLIGDVTDLFPPYAILLGLFTTSLFILHGALFLNMKTEGELQRRIQSWLQNILLLFFFLWATITILTLIFEPGMAEIFRNNPSYLAVVFITPVSLILIPKLVQRNCEGRAFLSCFLIIGSLVLTYAAGTFPAVVKASNPAYSMTVTNSSASLLTLKILCITACMGIPLFILYAAYAYRVFKGKVELDTMSY